MLKKIALSFCLLLPSVAIAEEDASSALAFIISQNQSKEPVYSRKSQSRHTTGNSSIHNMVSNAASKHGVPVNIAHAVVKVESNYNCSARSHAGALGIMQTLPATARGVGISGSLTNCSTGLEAGMRYLSQIVRKHGTSCKALSLYERGMYAQPRCTGYGSKVIRLAYQN